MRKKVIHFWVPYPLQSAPSQRFRVEQYLPCIPAADFSYDVFSFLDENTWKIYYKKGQFLKKISGLSKGFIRRIGHLFKSGKADYIFILREASPVGPPVFEWLLTKVFRKKIIFDFDDAIWIPGGEKISFLKSLGKATWKIKHIIKWAYKISAGNKFLCDYASKYNTNVILLPTVVDTEKNYVEMRNQEEGDRIVVGWTGSHTTLHNLEIIEEVIPDLKKEIDFDFLVISNKPPGWNFDFIYKKWEEKTELKDLLIMHVGLMPLKQGPWFEGKCGFKLIQYLACGIPAIASPVGVNSRIAIAGQTGFIAGNNEEWKAALKKLITDTQLRVRMGKAGREHISKNYSLHNHLLLFLSLFS